MAQRRTCAIARESSAGKRPTLPTTNREGGSFHSDYIPPPPTSPQVSARKVRRARCHGPKLPGVFPADSAPPDSVCAFAQVTGLRPKALRIAKTAPFDTPTGYTKRASEPRFRRSEALSSTWWQVKDSNLRSFRDGFTVPRLQAGDQRRRLTRNNFRAYSPQIADVSRGQRDTPGHVHVPPLVADRETSVASSMVYSPHGGA